MAERIATYSQAINEALAQELERDPSVYLLGQDIGSMGGVYGVTRGLLTRFGTDRVRDAPISETAIIGSSVGAALAGMRPVAEIQFSDFLFVAMDEIVQKAAKWRYMHGANGGMHVPLVIRAPIGGYVAASAEHSGAYLSVFAHFPGLKVVVPFTPYDAKGLLIASIRDPNPVLFFEHKMLYRTRGHVPEESYTVPLGEAIVRRSGTDVTLVATAYMVQLSLQAAEELAKRGVSVEVIDLRSAEPLDMKTINESVRRTGRAVIVDEDHRKHGIGAEIGMQIVESCWSALKSAIGRVGAADVPIPYAPVMERAVLPSVERIVEAVDAQFTAKKVQPA